MSRTNPSLLDYSVLVVEDDPALREALVDTLELASINVVSAGNGEAALEILAKPNNITMIVSDINMGKMTGHDLLAAIKESYPHIPVLLMTAYGSVKDSVDAIRNGAVDYLVKPFEPQQLVEAVMLHTKGVSTSNQNQPIAHAQASLELFELAKRVAKSESTVLIMGESGTGKEVLARYIHQHSERYDKPFVAINCAAIPENMLEAILFGYEKGAYTGAHTTTPGKFEQANGGTILLDEISEMELGLQAKLLRVLQEREVERLGGRKTISLDVRVIATSNRNMLEQVASHQFREDLYYRLSVLPLQWLPLRERKDDIVPLANALLTKHAAKQKRSGILLSPCAQSALINHAWPGNVRELDNVVQRALVLQVSNIIYARDLGLDIGILKAQLPKPAQVQPATKVMESVGESGLESGLNSTAASALNTAEQTEFGDSDNDINSLGNGVKQREFEIIANTLKQEQGSRKKTAERLGISPRTLRYKLAKMRDMGMTVDSIMSMA